MLGFEESISPLKTSNSGLNPGLEAHSYPLAFYFICGLLHSVNTVETLQSLLYFKPLQVVHTSLKCLKIKTLVQNSIKKLSFGLK